MTRQLLTGLLLGATALSAQTETAKRLEASADVFKEVMDISDKAIPQKLLDKSYCAVVVPGLKKGAFIVGAKFGRGFVSCRKAGGAGWGALAAVRVEGGSVGFQIGGSETDVIMLVMNERGMKRLLQNKFTVGADASAAAGPIGRTATAETDAMLTAEILTWSRARGLFAGVSLQGSTLREDPDVNQDLYGKKMTNREVISGDPAAPAGAKRLLSLLNQYSSRQAK